MRTLRSLALASALLSLSSFAYAQEPGYESPCDQNPPPTREEVVPVDPLGGGAPSNPTSPSAASRGDSRDPNDFRSADDARRNGDGAPAEGGGSSYAGLPGADEDEVSKTVPIVPDDLTRARDRVARLEREKAVADRDRDEAKSALDEHRLHSPMGDDSEEYARLCNTFSLLAGLALKAKQDLAKAKTDLEAEEKKAAEEQARIEAERAQTVAPPVAEPVQPPSPPVASGTAPPPGQPARPAAPAAPPAPPTAPPKDEPQATGGKRCVGPDVSGDASDPDDDLVDEIIDSIFSSTRSGLNDYDVVHNSVGNLIRNHELGEWISRILSLSSVRGLYGVAWWLTKQAYHEAKEEISDAITDALSNAGNWYVNQKDLDLHGGGSVTIITAINKVTGHYTVTVNYTLGSATRGAGLGAGLLRTGRTYTIHYTGRVVP